MKSRRPYCRSTIYCVWWWYLHFSPFVGISFPGNQRQYNNNNNVVLAFSSQSSSARTRKGDGRTVIISPPYPSNIELVSSIRSRHEDDNQIQHRRSLFMLLSSSPRIRHYGSNLFLSSSDGQDSEPTDEGESEGSDITGNSNNNSNNNSTSVSRRRIRQRVKALAKSVVARPLALASTVPMPSAIAAVLKEASWAAVEQVEEALNQQRSDNNNNNNVGKNGGSISPEAGTESSKEIINSIVDEAFAPMEASLVELETSLQRARESLVTAKLQSFQAIEALQMAAVAQAEVTAQRAASAVAEVEQKAQRQVMAEIYSNAISGSGSANERVDLSTLTFDDVDYDSSEMAPPFLDPDSCLIPGEPVVRVEKAPENSRRIFAGIDIMASVDDVWNVLTDYAELQNVVPNLVVNEVLDLYEGSPNFKDINRPLYDANAPVEIQCKQLSQHMKGSLLKQVGGAKVAGINFSAKTTIEVREWPEGLPDFAHFTDDMWDGKSREARAKEYPKTKLKRYRFPRPFALSSLPTRDISMQSVVNDDGEFRMYQGVWRMQPLPGCAPPGKQAMRLSYAVEISPRAYLPVQLVEGRIVRDLCTNLEAIRNAVSN